MSKAIQALPAYLGAPIDATQTSFSIRGLKDTRGNYITSMIGDVMHATIEPRSTTNQEIVSWTGITDNGGGYITVTGVTRNINPQPPYGGQTGTIAHASGVEIILTDTAKRWSEYPSTEETATINDTWTFAVRPLITGTSADVTAVATKQDILDAALGSFLIGSLIVDGDAQGAVTENAVLFWDTANSGWAVAHANVSAEVSGTKLGIAQGTASDGIAIPGGVLIQGQSANFSGLSVGPVYISDTGTITNTPGTISVQVGVAVSATTVIFDPYMARTLTADQSAALAGGGDYGTPSSSNKFLTAATIASTTIFKIPTIQTFTASGTSHGVSGTQFDITNPTGTTWRYTWDGTGTDPNINSTTFPIGAQVRIKDVSSFFSGNQGIFAITGSGSNYFEVTNASGSSQSNVQLGGANQITVYQSQTWTKPAGLKYVEVEVLGGGAAGQEAGGDSAGAGGGAGGYARKLIAAASLAATETVKIGIGGYWGDTTSSGNSRYQPSATTFGSILTANGASSQTGGTATGGDFNIQGDYGISPVSSSTGPTVGGNGASSPYGTGGLGNSGSGGDALGYGSGGGGGENDSSSGTFYGGAGANGLVVVKHFYF